MEIEQIKTDNYREALNQINAMVTKLKVDDVGRLNELSAYLVYAKLQFVHAREETIEYYTYCAIQNLCICVDKCREEHLDKKITLEEVEKKIKQNWGKDYSKFQ